MPSIEEYDFEAAVLPNTSGLEFPHIHEVQNQEEESKGEDSSSSDQKQAAESRGK